MVFTEFHYRWSIPLESSPERLWPFVSDTNRFDRDSGVPPLERILGLGEGENGRHHLRLRLLGLKIEWEEQPFEWVRPQRTGVRRVYSRGPLSELRVLIELQPKPKGGTQLLYQVWIRPRNLLGRILAPIQVGVISRIRFAQTFRGYDRLAQTQPHSLFKPKAGSFAVAEEQRLDASRKDLLAKGLSEVLTERLVQHIQQGDELQLSKIRPFQLADEWNVSRKELLALCLHATRSGMLEFRWDILCPLCRGAKETRTSLKDLKTQVHCEVCQIDFEGSFDRNVEISFRPNPSIRKLNVYEYCAGSPQNTPHILAQQILPGNTTREIQLPLEEGHYRIRTLKLKGGREFCAQNNGDVRGQFTATSKGWQEEHLDLNLSPTLIFKNETTDEQVFILERTEWLDQAVTAVNVTSMQTFRDLFSTEALRPGEQISVGSITIVFTDLSSSTQLYRKIGDAPAFGYVMNHFDILKKTIDEESGAIVKTIGDAVMAVFTCPVNALRALQKAQLELARLSNYQQASLKAGIHYGPCIAVTLNDRLDYFGSTVNIAARLVGLAGSDEIIISSTVKNDPEVADWMKSNASPVTPIQAKLKGLENENFDLWKISR
jgi:adenylate cyclase